MVTSVSGPLWLEVELVEIVTSTHCFNSGDLVEMMNMRECMSQVVVEECLQWQTVSLSSLLENMYQIAQYLFEAGHIFGVYQPRSRNSRLSVRYASVPSGYGHLNYHRNFAMSLEKFNTAGSSTGNDYPLAAVDTSEISCIVRTELSF